MNAYGVFKRFPQEFEEVRVDNKIAELATDPNEEDTLHPVVSESEGQPNDRMVRTSEGRKKWSA